MFQKLSKMIKTLFRETERFLWKYFCLVMLFLFINILPVQWMPYLIIGAIGGLPSEIDVKEEKIEET